MADGGARRRRGPRPRARRAALGRARCGRGGRCLAWLPVGTLTARAAMGGALVLARGAARCSACWRAALLAGCANSPRAWARSSAVVSRRACARRSGPRGSWRARRSGGAALGAVLALAPLALLAGADEEGAARPPWREEEPSRSSDLGCSKFSAAITLLALSRPRVLARPARPGCARSRRARRSSLAGSGPARAAGKLVGGVAARLAGARGAAAIAGPRAARRSSRSRGRATWRGAPRWSTPWLGSVMRRASADLRSARRCVALRAARARARCSALAGRRRRRCSRLLVAAGARAWRRGSWS